MEGISEEEIEKFKLNFPKFYATVFGDSDWFGSQLKIAALYIMSYELLQDYIEGQFTFFFSNEMKRNKDGDFVNVLSIEFDEAKTRYSKGKKCSLFDAACNWFEDNGALTSEEREAITAFKSVRDELAHELFRVLISENYPELDKAIIYGPINLYHKVSNWWIRNFEASIAPENFENLDDDALNSATAFQVGILSMLTEKI